MALRRLLSLCLLIVPLLFAQGERFVVTNTGDLGPGSLHHAILEANALPGPDEIVFNIPGEGVQKIDVQRNGLPEITDPITIDGYSQPGASPNTLEVGNDARILIQIDGADNYRAPVNGVVISGGNSTLRGLSITGIPSRIYVGIPEDPPPPPPEGDAILIKGNGGNVIEGNFIGFAPSGQAVPYGAYIGVEVLSHGNRVGGVSPGARNVIARHEIAMSLGGAGNVIQGNYIGTDVSGQRHARSGGGATGIVISGRDCLIGGTEPGAGNVISGHNHLGGIIVDAIATGTTIQGNLLGMAADRTTILDDRYTQHVLISGSRNLIGGLESGAANVFGSFHSVEVRQVYSRNTATGNAILSNIYLWPSTLSNISLRAYSPSRILSGARNDLDDRDAGPNNLQNFPVLTSVHRSENSTRLRGGLNSTPSTSFVVQFYANARFGVGSRLLGSERLTTDSAGMAWFDFTFPVGTPERYVVTATATDEVGNTSQLSPESGDVELANISTRGHVGIGDDALIAGFLVRPARGETHWPRMQSKVLIRALGPSLASRGLQTQDLLADPSLELFDKNGVSIATNDNWRINQEQEIMTTGAAPQMDAEAAIVTTLPDGDYTAVVRGSGAGTGLGIVEVFRLPAADATSQLTNISTRGRVGPGDEALIAGVIVNGDAGQRLMARAIGADLAAVGLRDALLDPVLELRDASGNLLASNDDWKDTQQEEINGTGLIPTNEQNSALITTLIPGVYTALVRGKNDTVGLAVVEFYDLRRLLAENPR